MIPNLSGLDWAYARRAYGRDWTGFMVSYGRGAKPKDFALTLFVSHYRLTSKPSRGNLNSNAVLPVPHSRSINSSFEADVLETQAKLGKMLMIFVISISKLTKTARSDEEVREAYSDSLLVRNGFTPRRIPG